MCEKVKLQVPDGLQSDIIQVILLPSHCEINQLRIILRLLEHSTRTISLVFSHYFHFSDIRPGGWQVAQDEEEG